MSATQPAAILAPPYRTLIIEDDADTRANLADILELDGFETVTAGSASEAMARSDWDRIAVVILDRKLPDGNALELLPRIRELSPHASVVVVTGYADLDGAVTALRYGALDYILKPINADALRASLERITDRLRTQRDLEESRKQLEAERQRALHNERLAAIGETMTALVHESRNALQRSKACLEMLSLEVQDRPKAVDLVARVQRAQEDLQKLFEEVREYAAPLNLKMASCDLDKIWRQAWQELAHLHTQKRLRLMETAAETRSVSGDRFALTQVFRNILENAVQASPPDGTISINYKSTASHGTQEAAIRISDEGPGIAAENRARVLEPFFTTKTKGTGLGLAIAQRIVECHGGKLEVGNPPRGTEIHIYLPQLQNE